MGWSFRFLRVRGIPIEAHWSWIIIAVLYYRAFVYQVVPRDYPGLSDSTYIGMALAAAALFFISILLHELGHAFQGLREGMGIEKITLWAFGGMAWLTGGIPSPGAEARVAAAGPFVTLVLGGAFSFLSNFADSAGWPAEVLGVTSFLGRINLILFFLNLLPAFPLDGGRILRSALWKIRGSYWIGTIWAVRVGNVLAGVAIAYGSFKLFEGETTSALYYIIGGAILLQAQSMAGADGQRITPNLLRVGHVMQAEPVILRPEMTVEEFLQAVGRARGRALEPYPIVEGRDLLGVVSLGLATQVPPERRVNTSMRDLMITREAAVTLTAQIPADQALEALQAGPGHGVILEEKSDRVAAVILASDLAGVLLDFSEARRKGIPPKARPRLFSFREPKEG